MDKVQLWIEGFVSNPWVLFVGLLCTAIPIMIWALRFAGKAVSALVEVFSSSLKSYLFKLMIQNIRKNSCRKDGYYINKGISNLDIYLRIHSDKTTLYFYLYSVIFISYAAGSFGIDVIGAAYLYSSLFGVAVGLSQLAEFRARKQVLRFAMRSASRERDRILAQKTELESLRDSIERLEKQDMAVNEAEGA